MALDIKNLFPLFEPKLLADIEMNAAIKEFAEGEGLMKSGQNIKSTHPDKRRVGKSV